MKLIIPEPLEPGDTVGIVAPAGPVTKELVQKGKRFLEDLGFKVRLGKHLFNKNNYLAGTDEERAQDIMEMFRAPDVRAIISARGGYGCLRLLRHLDFPLIKDNPKIFLGYSDISILLNTIYERTGLVTFHGPMLRQIAENDKLTVRVFKQFLMEANNDFTYRVPDLKTVKAGKAAGPLAGGCLSVIISTLGTEYEPVLDGKILFFEDVDEPLYRIDRMLTQLKLSGRLKSISGVIAGRIKGIKKEELSLLLDDIFQGMNIPVVVNFPAGHQLPNLVLPVGATFFLDADAPVVSVRFHEVMA